MPDQVEGFVVLLGEPMDKHDAERIAESIRFNRHVATVEPLLGDPNASSLAEMRGMWKVMGRVRGTLGDISKEEIEFAQRASREMALDEIIEAHEDHA